MCKSFASFIANSRIMPLLLPKHLLPINTDKTDSSEVAESPSTVKSPSSIKSPTHESESEAHRLFRSVAGHAPAHRRRTTVLDDNKPKDKDNKSASKTDTIAEENGPGEQSDDDTEPIPGILAPGSTGVIYVTDRAVSSGFTMDDPEWANMGQGAPEVGPIPGAADKPKVIDLEAMGINVHEYAPTTGVKELRAAVANLYNVSYRQNHTSKYTYENVCIVPGGRAGLTRVASVVGDVYFTPEYTAYDQMLSIFKRLVPIPTALTAENNYKLNIETLKHQIASMGLSCVFASNPRNPTGEAVAGEELKELVAVGRDSSCTMVLDEFYSAYALENVGTPQEGEGLSAARYIEDVNKDPIILIDGLTKNWRCPGWRTCWVVAPKKVISALSQSGSFLDGGASHILQVAALPLLEPERVAKDRVALQRHFRYKRDKIIARLRDMGFDVRPPAYTFYIWLDLQKLPPPINSGLVMMEMLIKEKTIVTPGLFFDLNPSHRRNLFSSPAHHFIRISYGPPLEQVEKGLDGLQRVIDRANKLMDEQGHLGDMGSNLAPHRTDNSASVQGASEHTGNVH